MQWHQCDSFPISVVKCRGGEDICPVTAERKYLNAARQYTNKSSSDLGAFVLGLKELGRASQLFYSRFEMRP
jgi:hypothetical protein